MLEVFGLATAFAAADAGCKAGNVRLENFDKNKTCECRRIACTVDRNGQVPRTGCRCGGST